MSPRRALPFLVLTALVTAVPAAQADTLQAAAPGARGLAYAGGWTAWAQPAGDRWQVVTRAPDGTVAAPSLPTFGAAPDLSIGTDGQRRLQLVYARCDGASTTAGCDVFRFALGGGAREEPVRALATEGASEAAPSLSNGTWAFVRRGAVPAARKGVFAYVERTGRTRRVSPTLARETATNGTRVAFTYAGSRGGGIAIRRVSGEGGLLSPVTRATVVPRSLQLTRYQAAWLQADTAFTTTRFAGSGGPYAPRTVRGRTVPGIAGLAVGASTNRARFLDAEGVKAPSPPLFTP